MAVIRHEWTIYLDSLDGRTVVTTMEGHAGRVISDATPVEVVPAEQLRGAVAGAETVAREMRAYAFTHARFGDSGWADDVIRWADALAPTTGGQ